MQRRQRQAQVMHAVTPVQHLDHPGRLQLDLRDHPIQPRPDPRRTVGRERHDLGFRGSQSVQVERHQFDQRIRAPQRPVDDRPAPLGHPPLLIGLEEEHHLGLTPLDAELPPLLLATDADLRDDRAHPDPAAIDPHRDPLAGEFVTRGQRAGAEPEQVADPRRQHLLSQFASDSPHRFLVQFQATSRQLGACLLDRQLTDQAAHFGLDVGTRSLADPIGRQFRVEPTSLDASSLAAAPSRRAVQRHHRDHQAPQKPDHQGATFFPGARQLVRPYLAQATLRIGSGNTRSGSARSRRQPLSSPLRCAASSAAKASTP
jgi:hypothetical protein